MAVIAIVVITSIYPVNVGVVSLSSNVNQSTECASWQLAEGNNHLATVMQSTTPTFCADSPLFSLLTLLTYLGTYTYKPYYFMFLTLIPLFLGWYLVGITYVFSQWPKLRNIRHDKVPFWITTSYDKYCIWKTCSIFSSMWFLLTINKTGD